MIRKPYYPRPSLYVACFLASIAFVQWQAERMCVDRAMLYLQVANRHYDDLVDLVYAGKRIEAIA